MGVGRRQLEVAVIGVTWAADRPSSEVSSLRSAASTRLAQSRSQAANRRGAATSGGIWARKASLDERSAQFAGMRALPKECPVVEHLPCAVIPLTSQAA